MYIKSPTNKVSEIANVLVFGTNWDREHQESNF